MDEERRVRLKRNQERFNERHPGNRAHRQRVFRERNPDADAEHKQRYRATAKGKASIAVANHRRRARRGGPASADTRAYVAIIRHDPCAYCGGLGGTVDHVVPLSATGRNDWENCTGACERCNKSKYTTSLLDFLLARAA